MARPSFTDLTQGLESWDAWLNDFKDALVNAPLPVAIYADFSSLPAAASYDQCVAITTDTKELWLSDGSAWRSIGGGLVNANGARGGVRIATTELTLTGSLTWANAFPAGATKLSVSGRVTELVTSGDGGTDLDIGDGTDADIYKATLAFTAGGTFRSDVDRTASISKDSLTAAENIVVTMNGGTPSAGKVRLVAMYLELTAPTS